MGCGTSSQLENTIVLQKRLDTDHRPRAKPVKAGELNKIFDTANVDMKSRNKWQETVQLAADGVYTDDTERRAFTSSGANAADTTWKRAKDLYGDTGFTVYEACKSTDLQPGKLSSSNIINALTVLAEKPLFIKRLFEADDVVKQGCYAIWLCLNGVWDSYVVDDSVPCDKEGNALLTTCKSKEIWSYLIEKALAKALGGYDKLAKLTLNSALRTLTGAPTVNYPLPNVGDNAPPASKWEAIRANVNDSHLVCVSDKAGNSFAVAAFKEVAKEGNPVRLVKFRDPRSLYKWDGDWSKSSQLWTDDIKKASGFKDDEANVFWMEVNDVEKNMETVTVCQLDGSYYYQYVSVEVEEPNRSWYELKVKVKKAGKCHLTVHLQENIADKDQQYAYVTVVLLKVQEMGGKKTRTYVDCKDDQSSCLLLGFDAEVADYFVVISSAWPDRKAQNFTVSCYSPSNPDFGYIPDEESLVSEMCFEGLFDQIVKSTTAKHTTLAKQGFDKMKKHEGIVAGFIIIAYENQTSDHIYLENMNFSKLAGLEFLGDWDSPNYLQMMCPGNETRMYALRICDPSNWNYFYSGDFKVYTTVMEDQSNAANEVKQEASKDTKQTNKAEGQEGDVNEGMKSSKKIGDLLKQNI